VARRRRKSAPEHMLHPQNWGQCLAIATLWVWGNLPWRMALGLGRFLGRVGYHLAPTRRGVARRNLELCFPAMDADTRETLVKDNFAFTGKGIAELALAWYGGAGVDRIPLEVHGMDNFQAALDNGRPVITLSGHFTSLELVGRLMKSRARIAAIYKPVPKKPVINRAMHRARLRTAADALRRDDIRGIVRTLKGGMPVWYAGDQDYGRRHSVFAPFFGTPAATITALTRFTRMSNAQVVPLFFNSKPDHSGYEVYFEPALPHFPTGDDVLDATRMNQALEKAVERHPEQYLWIHKRFKRQEDRRQDLYATDV